MSRYTINFFDCYDNDWTDEEVYLQFVDDSDEQYRDDICSYLTDRYGFGEVNSLQKVITPSDCQVRSIIIPKLDEEIN